LKKAILHNLLLFHETQVQIQKQKQKRKGKDYKLPISNPGGSAHHKARRDRRKIVSQFVLPLK